MINYLIVSLSVIIGFLSPNKSMFDKSIATFAFTRHRGHPLSLASKQEFMISVIRTINSNKLVRETIIE